jgi:hypothetical protein
MAMFSTWNKDGISVQMHSPLPMIGLMVPMAGAASFMFMGRAPSMERRNIMIDLEESKPGGPLHPVPVAPPRKPEIGTPVSPEVRAAQAKERELSSYVRAFLLTERRLPTSLGELVEMNILNAVPMDPWGNGYTLRITNAKTKRFQVVSAGPDGIVGNADDVAIGR